MDALIRDYNTRISTLKRLNREYEAEKVGKINQLEQKVQKKIANLEKQKEQIESDFTSQLNKFYEDLGAQKRQLENKISRETEYVQEWTTKYTKSKEVVDKLEENKHNKTGQYDKKLSELDAETSKYQTEYERITGRLQQLDEETKENYTALANLPPLDIEGLTHESSDKRSAFTNKILWAQIQHTNEIYKLSYEKIDLDQKLKDVGQRCNDVAAAKEQYLQLQEAELKEPHQTLRYNQKSMNKYKSKLKKTREDLQALLDTEEPFKSQNEADKKTEREKINKKIRKLKNELPAKRKQIKKEYDDMVAANENTIVNLNSQLKKAEQMESQLKKRLDELNPAVPNSK